LQVLHLFCVYSVILHRCFYLDRTLLELAIFEEKRRNKANIIISFYLVPVAFPPTHKYMTIRSVVYDMYDIVCAAWPISG